MLDYMVEIMKNINKVKAMLRMWIHRRRYTKKRASLVKIQSIFRMKIAQLKFKKLKREKKEAEAVAKINKEIKRKENI